MLCLESKNKIEPVLASDRPSYFYSIDFWAIATPGAKHTILNQNSDRMSLINAIGNFYSGDFWALVTPGAKHISPN